MKKIISVMLAAALCITCFAGCAQTGNGSSGGGQPTGQTDTNTNTGSGGDTDGTKVLKIGVCDSMTGPGAGYGLPGANGVKAAVETLNAEGGIKIGDDTYTVELISYDNKSDAGEAVAALQKLIDMDNVQFILGWSASTAAMAAVQAIKDKDVTMVVGNARAPDILLHSTGNVWRSATVNCYYPIEDVKYMQQNGVNSIAFIAHMNDSTFSAHIDLMAECCKELGVEVVAIENVNAGDRDMLTQCTNVKNANPDAVFTATNVEESAFALRQLREVGCNAPMYTFSGGIGRQWLEVCSNEALEGCYGIRPQCADLGSENDAESRAFFEAYDKVFGEIPSQTATYTWDNFWLLMCAFQKAGTTDWKTVNAAFAALTLDDLAAEPHIIMNYEAVDAENHVFDYRGQAFAPASVLKWDTEIQDWAYEATIASGGAEFPNKWLDEYAAQKGIDEPEKVR